MPFRSPRLGAARSPIDAASAVSGYMIGNLLISLIAGVAGVHPPAGCSAFRNPFVLALLVAFADLIPLVGATIGAAVARARRIPPLADRGLIALVFFVIYQQIENGVIYPSVMARKVKVNPLVVLLSVLPASSCSASSARCSPSRCRARCRWR